MLVKEIIEGYKESISFENQIGTFTISPNRVKYTLLRNKYYHIAKEVYDKDRYVSQVKIIGDIKVKGYIIQLPVSDDRVVKSVTINGRLVDKYDEHSVFSIDDEEDDDLNFPEDNE